MNFGKEKIEKKKKEKENKVIQSKIKLHKIGRTVVCLSPVTVGNYYLMTKKIHSVLTYKQNYIRLSIVGR